MLAFLMFSLLTCTNANLENKSYELIYTPKVETDIALNKFVNKKIKIAPPYNVDFNFHLKAKNPPKGQMAGWYVQTWNQGATNASCIGGGSFVPIDDFCKLILKETTKVDSLKPNIEIQYFSVNENGKQTRGKPYKISMERGGIYKINDKERINLKQNEILNLVAYLSIAENPSYMNMSANEIEEIRKLPFDEFVELHVKKNDGFLAFFRSSDEKTFFAKQKK